FDPERADRVVLVWRRDISVLHRTLDADEAVLAARIATGVRFAELCDVLGGIHGDTASQRATELLLRWLRAAAPTSTASENRCTANCNSYSRHRSAQGATKCCIATAEIISRRICQL